MTQREDVERSKSEMNAGCVDRGVVEVVNFECARRWKKRRGKEDGRRGSLTRANDGETKVRVNEDLGTSRPSHPSLRLGCLSLLISTPTLSLQIDSPFTCTRPSCVITGSKYIQLGKTISFSHNTEGLTVC